MKRSSKAFSLMELLTAISVIAFLCVILIPAGQRMLEQGKESESLSRMRQTGTALLSYAGDSNGKLFSVDVPIVRWPVLVADRLGIDNATGTHQEINNRVYSNEIFRPVQNDSVTRAMQSGRTDPGPSGVFALNDFFSGRDYPSNRRTTWRTLNIKKLSSTPMLAFAEPGGGWFLWQLSPGPSATSEGWSGSVHLHGAAVSTSGKMPVMMFDGSVRLEGDFSLYNGGEFPAESWRNFHPRREEPEHINVPAPLP